MSTSDPRSSLILIGGLIFLGILLIVIVLPILGRLSLLVEVASLLSEPLGDYVGNPRLVMLGCGVLLLVVAGCCVVVLLLGSALLTCNTANPASICHLVGR